jgi:hypothetical protein
MSATILSWVEHMSPAEIAFPSVRRKCLKVEPTPDLGGSSTLGILPSANRVVKRSCGGVSEVTHDSGDVLADVPDLQAHKVPLGLWSFGRHWPTNRERAGCPADISTLVALERRALFGIFQGVGRQGGRGPFDTFGGLCEPS